MLAEHRLAYVSNAPVNWCPGLGTVLSNEEVTADGRSERGNHPVFRRPLAQWMLRITAYAERLLADLDTLHWPEAVVTMQRNWIGRSEGARRFDFDLDGHDASVDGVHHPARHASIGATYMVLAPEHPLVDDVVTDSWSRRRHPGCLDRRATSARPRRWPPTGTPPPNARIARRTAADDKTKTGVVHRGARATVPFDRSSEIPVFISDYVLMGYGTGAIMAVPGQDQRDWDFAVAYELPIIRTVTPPADFDGEAFVGEGPAQNSGFLDGMGVDEAKAAMIDHLVAEGQGERTVTYRLRDWLFSRQRYWGEPFPIVFDDDGTPRAVPDELLPIELPPIDDWAPRELDEHADPEPPLGRATDWTTVELDLGDGDGPQTYRRELNTMPNWAGSCWYHLRYLDPTNADALVDPAVDEYWMNVDLYVGGVEHAVLHLLYSRFWQKVLFDLGHVSTAEPYQRLFNQGYIQAAAYTDDRGVYVDAAAVVEADGAFTFEGQPVAREFGKMGKSLRNAVTPEEIYDGYGADTLRLYEMSMGPLDADRPWDTRSIVGSHRLIQRIWRTIVDEDTGAVTVDDAEPDVETLRVLHRTIDGVGGDYDGLRMNTAVAKLTELTNHVTKTYAEAATPRVVAEATVLMLAPLAPHVAEELWARLGHEATLTYEPFPTADEQYLVADTVEIAVQVKGKVRARIDVAADASEEDLTAAGLAAVAEHLDGEPRKVIVVPGRLVNVIP